MLQTYDEAMEKGVFPIEGGYTNDPRDPGGPTNFGITLADARQYWKASATAIDVKNMPKRVAETIYAEHYATTLRYNDLPAGLDYSVLDYGINSGTGRAGKVLRRLVGLDDSTSAITDIVIGELRKRNTIALINAIWDERLKFLKSLSTWDHFGPGWERRCVEGRSLALHLASELPMVEAPSITPTQDGNTMAKGAVPAPIAAKKVIAACSAVPAASAVNWSDWVYSHQGTAALIGIACIAGIFVAIALIERAHQSKQEAATPGILPVRAAA